jgi:predicted dehydrogenase
VPANAPADTPAQASRRAQPRSLRLDGRFPEDAAQARLYFENGCIADLTASRINPVVSRSLTAWSAAGCVTVDMHQREVKSFSPGEALLHGTPPLVQASQPGADLEALKKDVFGHFVKIESFPVNAAGPDALTQELTEFAQCVIEGRAPHVDGIQALEAMIVAGKVLEQVACHQWDGHSSGPVGPYPQLVPSLRKAG